MISILAAFAVFLRPAQAIDVHASINGQDTVIGDISASNGYYQNDPTTGQLLETATFTLGSAYRDYMDDTMPCQFRWFQIVTSDPSPPSWMGSAPTVPYTDPPSGGWDYERSPKYNYTNGVPGADNWPFYEDNPGFGGSFDYNLWHNTTNGTSRTLDRPGLPNGSLQFQTYLVFINPQLAAQMKFIPLIGYSWGGAGDGTNGVSFNGPTIINPGGFNFNTMQTALNNDGFNAWSPTTGDVVCAVPEPSACLCVMFSVTALVVVRKYRSRT